MLEVQHILTSANIPYNVVEHAPVYTVAESMEHLPGAYPVKNLLLKEEKGDRCVFVIMKGDERLDTKHIAQVLEMKKLQFAKPEILMHFLGVEPGSASLFSLLHKGSESLEVVIDNRIIDQDVVGFHPSINTQTIYISGRDVVSFLECIGRKYVVVSFDS